MLGLGSIGFQFFQKYLRLQKLPVIGVREWVVSKCIVQHAEHFEDDEYKHDWCLFVRILLKLKMLNLDAVPSEFDQCKSNSGNPDRNLERCRQ